MEHVTTMTIHWDTFIDKLFQAKDIGKTALQELEPGRELIRHLMEQDLPFDYILDVPDSAFEAAETILGGQGTVADVTLQSLDDTVWSELWNEFNQLPSRPDPSVQEEFI